MIDYLRVLRANKVTLAGIALGCVGAAICPPDNNAEMIVSSALLGASNVALYASMCGYETYASFNMTKKHLQRHDSVQRWFSDGNMEYCRAVGVVAAAELEGKTDGLDKRLLQGANINGIIRRQALPFVLSSICTASVYYTAIILVQSAAR